MPAGAFAGSQAVQADTSSRAYTSGGDSIRHNHQYYCTCGHATCRVCKCLQLIGVAEACVGRAWILIAVFCWPNTLSTPNDAIQMHPTLSGTLMKVLHCLGKSINRTWFFFQVTIMIHSVRNGSIHCNFSIVCAMAWMFNWFLVIDQALPGIMYQRGKATTGIRVHEFVTGVLNCRHW